MNNPILTATYTYTPQPGSPPTQPKQIALSAPVNAQIPPTCSQLSTASANANADADSKTSENSSATAMDYTKTKHAYLSALRAAASKVQDDVNALLTAEMQADKVRDAATANGCERTEMQQGGGRAQGKRRRDELAGGHDDVEGEEDEDDIGLEDEGDEEM